MENLPVLYSTYKQENSFKDFIQRQRTNWNGTPNQNRGIGAIGEGSEFGHCTQQDAKNRTDPTAFLPRHPVPADSHFDKGRFPVHQREMILLPQRFRDEQ